jgi:phosphate transport system permease protein
MSTAPAPEPFSLAARGRVRRRKFVNRLMEGLGVFAALGAVAVLGIVIVSVLLRGIPALNLDLFTKTEATFGVAGGGIANSIVGTIVLVCLATLMALPMGVLVAVYVMEFAYTKVGRFIRLALDVLNGVPSIVIGVFVFALLVQGSKQSAWAGAFALAVVMLPLVSRAAMEVLALVPATLREASAGLGVSRWRTVVRVVMPTVLGGILTGTILAVARAAGETAPLLFTCSIAANVVSWDPSQALASLPVTIFIYSEAPDKSLNDQAWAAAFILMMFVLVASSFARWFVGRSKRKLEGR